MSIFIEKKGDSTSTINTGKATQDLPKATINYALTKESFAFDTLADAKSKTKWDEAKAAKDLVIMFSVENSELSNSEATFYEARTVKEKTKKARRGIKFTHHLDMFSDAALASYENSEYTRIIEFKEDGRFTTIKENGKWKGQKMSEFIVGMNEDSTVSGDPSKTTAEVVYADADAIRKGGQMLIPEFDLETYQGIYNVVFEVTAQSATEIKATAYNYDGNEVKGLVLADFKLLTVVNAPQAITASSYVNGEYVLTGTGLVTGTLNTNGVVTQSQIMYEGAEPVTVTIP